MRTLLHCPHVLGCFFALALLNTHCDTSNQRKTVSDEPAETKRTDTRSEHPDPDSKKQPELLIRQQGTPIGESRGILVLLHGYGAQGRDLMGLGSALGAPLSFTELYPQAPLALGNDRYAWFRRDGRGFSAALQKVGGFLRGLRQQYPEKSIIIAGFSQGAMLSAQLLLDAQSALQGALLFSPAIQGELPVESEAPRFPIFISHGTQDRILPFRGGKNLEQQFTDAGYSVRFIEFQGGHSIPRIARKEAANYLSERIQAEEKSEKPSKLLGLE
ncbi:MAG: alpha/beta hydrolase [Polyangiaceae bacterium]|nr:alpha/beta hydrolase [Polyangiaceae bacterium]